MQMLQQNSQYATLLPDDLIRHLNKATVSPPPIKAFTTIDCTSNNNVTKKSFVEPLKAKNPDALSTSAHSSENDQNPLLHPPLTTKSPHILVRI